MVRVQKSPESLQLRQQCYSWIFHPDNSPRMPRESIMQSVILVRCRSVCVLLPWLCIVRDVAHREAWRKEFQHCKFMQIVMKLWRCPGYRMRGSDSASSEMHVVSGFVTCPVKKSSILCEGWRGKSSHFAGCLMPEDPIWRLQSNSRSLHADTHGSWSALNTSEDI